MKIFPKKGIDQLLFGMKPAAVEKIMGQPNKRFDDEDQNKIYLYDNEKLSLTFYEEENFRLGYITTTNSKFTVFEKSIIGLTIKDAKKSISEIQKWELEDFDNFEHHFSVRRFKIVSED